jgi:hypothetical protein
MSESSQSITSSPDVAAILAGMLSNPEALSKIGGILSKFTAGESGLNPPQNEQVGAESEDVISTPSDYQADISTVSPTEQKAGEGGGALDFSKIASIFGGGFDPKKSQNKEQIALLSAIRPYVSPRRRELIDTFIKFNYLGNFFNKINPDGGSNVLQQK